MKIPSKSVLQTAFCHQEIHLAHTAYSQHHFHSTLSEEKQPVCKSIVRVQSFAYYTKLPGACIDLTTWPSTVKKCGGGGLSLEIPG